MYYLKPNANDILGDMWANDTRAIWHKMKVVDPELCGRKGAFGLWQFLQCQAAEMPGRVVASPQAAAICGEPYDSALLTPLVELTDRVCEAMDEGRPIVTPDDNQQKELF